MTKLMKILIMKLWQMAGPSNGGVSGKQSEASLILPAQTLITQLHNHPLPPQNMYTKGSLWPALLPNK